jgi:hypothetical protein
VACSGVIFTFTLLVIKSEPRLPSRYSDYVASWATERLVFDSRQKQATFIFLPISTPTDATFDRFLFSIYRVFHDFRS